MPTARSGTAAAPGPGAMPGIWSFAPTKTISTGEGGMLVSRNPEAIEFARAFRNYGKPDYAVHGLNFRLNEFTAAIGLVQTTRLDEIVAWKNEAARTHLDPLYRVAAAAARRDDVRALQVHRVRADRALDREGLRRAVPPGARPRGRPAELGLGGAESLVRAPLLPARTREEAMQ